MAAKGTKAGSVYVEIALDKEQFDKDFKAAGREVAAVQKQLSLEMERNKVRFAVEGVDKTWADKLFGSTVIGKIRDASKETTFLNNQLAFQQNKVDIAKMAWEGMSASKGAASAAALGLERAFLREQQTLVGLKKQLENATNASGVMAGAMKTSAAVIAAAVATMAASYAEAVKTAVEWGQAVEDIVKTTGMESEAASRLLGVMNIVGIGTEEAVGAMAKMGKSVSAAAKAQDEAAKAGKDSADVFTSFGIAIKDADGKLLDQETIIGNIIEVHRNMKDGIQKTALEMAIFGKSGFKMNDFLNLSKEKMTEYNKELKEMGLTIKESEQYEEFNRKLNTMHLSFKAIAMTIAGDDVPALTAYIGKLTELSKWLHENKDVIDDVKGGFGTAASVIGYPFVKSLELAGGAIKKYVELRKAELGEIKNEQAGVSETDFVERQAKAAKNAADLAKEATDKAREKAAADKASSQAQKELQTAILQIQNFTLQATLANIETERKAWQAKTQDEVAATKWAEAAKTKAVKDAVDQRLGPEVAAAKKAIQDGSDVFAAIQQASTARKLDEKQDFDAKAAVRDFYGIKLPGETQTKLNVDVLAGVISSFKETVKELVIPKDRYGQTVFDPYNPNAKGQVIPGQNLTVTNNVSVNVNGMDAASANQLGQIAAKELRPVIIEALTPAKGQY